jgi:hypothetical protein
MSQNGRYIFMFNNDDSLAGKINKYYVNNKATPFTPLSSRIQRDTENPSLEQYISDKFTHSLTLQQNGSSFCSPNGNGVGANYIYQEFIQHNKGLRWTILINTILYCDADGNPYAFLMYKNHPGDQNAVYISILCVNALVPREHYPEIYGNLIVNNFKVACETVNVHKIYLESLPTAEPFWINERFSLVNPQQQLSNDNDRLFYLKFKPNSGGSKRRKRNKKIKTKRKRNKKTMNKTRKK